MIRTAIIAAAMLTACPLFPVAAQADQAASPAPVIQMDHISVVSTGSGEPVILIPGLSSPRAVWDGITPELARTRRILLVQANGFGGDDPRANLKPGVLDGIVADLDALIVREKLGRPAVVGHSLGGLVGMMLASRHPDRVGRLMVVDALPFIGTLFGANDVAAITPRATQMRDAMLAAAPGMAAVEPVTSDPGGIWSNTPAGRIQVANWSMKANPAVVAHALYEDMVTDVRADLAKITAKPFTLLYTTAGGPQVDAIWRQGYAGSAAKMVPVADSYHFIMLDQPARFADEINRFLSE